MSQTRKQAHVEILTNQIVGILGGWFILYGTHDFMSELLPAQMATAYSCIFFVWSYTRSYTLRRIFNHLHSK